MSRTGEEQARRFWGGVSLSRENLLPFLYKLHYSMHLPTIGGLDSGIVFMGFVGLVWAFDALIALYISFPNRKQWKRAFAFRFKEGSAKLLFDVHRSGGVWLWPLLLILAVTSVSMNFGEPVVRPVVSLFSTLTPRPWDTRSAISPKAQKAPAVDRAAVLALAAAEGARRGFKKPPGALMYVSEYAAWGVGFFEAGQDHGDGGLGNAWLYFDDTTGAISGEDIPGAGSLGDLFLKAQFPLHSGRIWGVAGRVMVSILGLLVAVLSVTGVVIWARKKRKQRAAPVS